jgi:hypothetical protein
MTWLSKLTTRSWSSVNFAGHLHLDLNGRQYQWLKVVLCCYVSRDREREDHKKEVKRKNCSYSEKLLSFLGLFVTISKVDRRK